MQHKIYISTCGIADCVSTNMAILHKQIELWPSKLLWTAVAHPILALLSILSTWLVVRYLNSVRLRRKLLWERNTSSQPVLSPRIPSVIPQVGHFISNIIYGQGYYSSLIRQYPTCSVLTLPVMGSTHHVVVGPSLAHQVFTNPKVTGKFSGETFFFDLAERFFGDNQKIFRNMDKNILRHHITDAVHGFQRELFLNPGMRELNDSVSSRILKLTSFESLPEKQELWERAADVQISKASPQTNSQPSVVVRLHPLLRDIVGLIAINIILGPDFLRNFPNVLVDLFQVDESLLLFLSNLPLPALRSPKKARERVLAAIREHHYAYYRYTQGQDAGPRWPNIRQISNVVADRIKGFAMMGDFDESKPESERGVASALGDIGIMWALNVNANQVTFWLVYHIFSDPTLLAQIRQEIEPYVRKTEDEAASIDLEGLQKWCPLLKGAFLETMRLETGSNIMRLVEEDFTLTESARDAEVFRHEVPQTYVFRKGEAVCVPNGVHQGDDRYFPDPDTFDTKRFWVRNENEIFQDTDEGDKGHSDKQKMQEKDGSKQEPVKVDYKTMHPWGGGPTVCKGKKFAEAEVLLFAAPILMFWNMERVDGQEGKRIDWKPHPGHKTGSGAVIPKTDVWVRLWRKEAS